MRDRPRILYITSHCPYGEIYGAQLRTLQVGRLLKRIGDVSLVLVDDGSMTERSIEETRSEFHVPLVARVVTEPIGLTGRLRHELDVRYLNTHGTVVHRQDRAILADLIKNYDVTWIHTLRTANNFRQWRWERSIIDVDDLYSQYFQTNGIQAKSYFQKLQSGRKSWLWKRREGDLFNRFCGSTVCSEEDRNKLSAPERTIVLPNGYDDPLPVRRNVRARLGVVGKMNYLPNQDGVDWFLTFVWPKVRNKAPEAEFRIIGSGANENWSRIPGVHVLGYVDDTSAEVATWAGMVVPLHTGAGTRVKIAEAFARGCPVLSTSVGAFGYQVRHAQELLIADLPDDFAECCDRLLRSPELGVGLSERGRNYFLTNLCWDALLPRAEAAVHMALTMPTW